jgi:two-component system, cell cycle sensor histidine kinase and response regulator CckA
MRLHQPTVNSLRLNEAHGCNGEQAHAGVVAIPGDRAKVATARPAAVVAAGALGLAVLLLALLALAAPPDALGGLAYLPGAVAVALVVFLCFLGLARVGASLTALRPPAPEIAHFHGHLEPVLITDLEGGLLARNPAAEDISSLARPDRAGFLAPWVGDAPACLYRLLREVAANGVAVHVPDAPGERSRVTVTRLGRRRLLWRVEDGAQGPWPSPGGGELALPWLRVDAAGAVLGANAALTEFLPETPRRLEDVLVDLPLRPGGVHLLAGGRAARVLPLAEGGNARDLLILPLDGAEISGLVPNHFLDELPVALARLEPSGRLIYANKAALALLGNRAVPGTSLSELIEGLGRSIAERLADTVKGRALGRSEVARGTVSGQEIFLQVAFTRTIFDGSPSLLAVFSDATELKTLEAQFVQSQKMQAVGQLAGGVAHDFNNLLTAINGHCDLLLMRHDVADVEHGDLMQIRQNANRAAALVRQLLAFSRKQTLRPTVIDLRDTLAELAHLLNRLLTDKVTLKIEHGPDLWPVRVDERQLEQVIMNLVVNARDAMPSGGEVRIATRNVRLAQDLHRDRAVILPGEYVVIEVADSGMGIPKDKLHKIFEPFYTTKPVGEGTGLGLSTAYGIIKQTGGFIFADSPPGQGAIFTIYLPAYEKAEPAPLPAAEARRVRDLTGRGHVLLVEDEDPVRAFAARALRLRGYTVTEAASGEEALALLEDGGLHVDIMVSDVIMPGLDGPAWVREARGARPDAKVIFMSGYAEEAFTGASGLGDAGFLPKPFTLNELTQKVKETLEA